MADAKALEYIQSILNQQVQCVLATQSKGLVFQHLMAYSMSDDLSTIYLASFAETQKVKNMSANPNVSLLWDNRTGNNVDHTDGFALSAQGEASILGAESQQAIAEQLLKRNDTLYKLLWKDDSVLVAVRVSSYHLALGYTQTFFYKPDNMTKR